MSAAILPWMDTLAAGAAMTVGLALATLPFGLALGLAFALAKTSHKPWVRALAEAYSTVFRALPELLTLLLIYFGGQILLQKLAAVTGLPLAVDVSPFVAGLIALALVFGAYSSETFFAALNAVDRGQIEAAQSLGMPPRQVFQRITAPQMVRFALPGLGNAWLVLLKDTALVSVVGLNDLLRMTSVAVQDTREPFQFYAVACAIYLAMSAVSAALIARAETTAGRGWEARS